jgi:hypothetical protein
MAKEFGLDPAAIDGRAGASAKENDSMPAINMHRARPRAGVVRLLRNFIIDTPRACSRGSYLR